MGELAHYLVDPWELVTLAVSCGTFAFLLVLVLSLRVTIRSLPTQFGPMLEKAAMGWVFDKESFTQADGSQGFKLVPSARAKAMIDAVMPVLIAQGIEWAQKNIKLGGGAPGAPGGGAGPEALLNMVPKKFRGIAALLMPYIPSFLGKMGVKGAAPAGGSSAANPFLGSGGQP